MGATTAIGWTDSTVNFWIGCTKVGPGCDFCYAEQYDKRTAGGVHWGVGAPRRKVKKAVDSMIAMNNVAPEWLADYEVASGNARAFGVPAPTFGPRRRVFVSSLSDFADLEAPLEWFCEAWATMHQCKNLALQLVTKRVSVIEKRLAEIPKGSGIPRTWPAHAGLIVTVVNQAEADRDVPRALALKAKLGIPWLGLSIEPQLGPITLRPEWLGGSDGEVQGERAFRLSGSSERRPGDREGRNDLESTQARMGPLETTSRQPPVPSSESGAHRGEIPSSSDHVERRSGLRAGASTGLHALQGADPAGDDHQSQRRQDEAQRPIESRTGDLFGSADPRQPRFENRSRGESERRRQSPSQTHAPAGPDDQAEARCGREVASDCRRLRDQDASGIEDRPRRSVGIDWTIGGGESKQGKNHVPRPYDLAWARSLRDQCAAAGVAYFQKQLGARPVNSFGPDAAICAFLGKLKDRAGADPAEWPDDLRVQTFPEALR